jgi:hypothetical protein
LAEFAQKQREAKGIVPADLRQAMALRHPIAHILKIFLYPVDIE